MSNEGKNTLARVSGCLRLHPLLCLWEQSCFRVKYEGECKSNRDGVPVRVCQSGYVRSTLAPIWGAEWSSMCHCYVWILTHLLSDRCCQRRCWPRHAFPVSLRLDPSSSWAGRKYSSQRVQLTPVPNSNLSARVDSVSPSFVQRFLSVHSPAIRETALDRHTSNANANDGASQRKCPFRGHPSRKHFSREHFSREHFSRECFSR